MKRLGSLLAGVMLAALLPAGAAIAAPSVVFLSPAPLALDQVPELSSKENRPVHLVAWVREAPVGALAEFELRAVSTTPPTLNSATLGGTFVTGDTVEHFFEIPDTWADGTYNLRVTIFNSDGSQQVAEDEQTVIVNNDDVVPPPPAENVELVVPDNGDQVGFFTPKGGRANTVVTANASSGAEQVRVLYTKSAPGSEPEWQQCGSSSTGANGFTTIRCTLAEGENPNAVTAIAAAANMTPAGVPADSRADDGTDAHRVTPYMAQPARVNVSPESAIAETGTCQLFVATVQDQLGRAIALANLDVHASGPDDQLSFATDDTSPFSANTSGYQAPGDGHVSDKRTIRCSDKTLTETRQGVHRAIGSADRMHIESTGGTNNAGSFTFALFSNRNVTGGTNISVWADANDDDNQNISEAAGGARLGWGQAPPPASTELFIDPDGPSATTGECQSMSLIAREGGSPLVGGNIDVHIAGPDSSVQFCSPAGASGTAPPQSGDHIADSHGDGARHAEGSTDQSGRFVFGVTSLSSGVTEVLGWLDQTDDDVLGPAEPRAPAEISWQPEGERDISLEANRNRVRKGRRVSLSGAIDGSSACEAGQLVRLRAKRPNGSFKTIAKKNTNSDGSFMFRPRVRVTKIYKAIAPKGEVCDLARSNNVRVRARG